MKIECIAIDLDDTLIYFKDNFQGMHDIFRQHELSANYVDTIAHQLVWTEGFSLQRLVEMLQERHPHLITHPKLPEKLEVWLRKNLTAYPDSIEYLTRWQKIVPVIIVTAGRECFQRHKAELMGLPITDIRVVRTPLNKPAIIKDLLENYPHIAFVDDSANNLNSVRNLFPSVTTVQIRRPNLVKQTYAVNHLYATDLATVDAVLFPKNKKTS